MSLCKFYVGICGNSFQIAAWVSFKKNICKESRLNAHDLDEALCLGGLDLLKSHLSGFLLEAFHLHCKEKVLIKFSVAMTQKPLKKNLALRL